MDLTMSEQSSIVCLLNGFTSVRERASEGITLFKCGCAHTDTHWIQLCREHGEPDEALHVQALQEHDTAAMIRELTT
jgi:hypothetical protein